MSHHGILGWLFNPTAAPIQPHIICLDDQFNSQIVAAVIIMQTVSNFPIFDSALSPIMQSQLEIFVVWYNIQHMHFCLTRAFTKKYHKIQKYPASGHFYVSIRFGFLTLTIKKMLRLAGKYVTYVEKNKVICLVKM